MSGQNGYSVFQDYVYRISKAAEQLSINNEEGSDEDVVIELAALVQSGVFDEMQEDDQFWSLVLKQIMKTAIQILDDDTQISPSVFTPLEAQYVEVLNYFDDHYQAWSKADYRLVHEQTKASFFHSRGGAFTSKQILDKAGECGLGLKLKEINSRIKCQLMEEMAFKDLGLDYIISNQSTDLNFENDPISLNPEVAQNCFIASASDVQFGICGTPPLLNVKLESVGIYPNPNEGNFKVILEDFQTCNEIRIWNSVGQLIQTIPASDEVIINLNLSLQKGIYLVEFRGEDRSITDKLVVH